MTQPRQQDCSYCEEPSVLTAVDPAGEMKRFCEECLLIVVQEALALIGDKLKDMLP